MVPTQVYEQRCPSIHSAMWATPYISQLNSRIKDGVWGNMRWSTMREAHRVRTNALTALPDLINPPPFHPHTSSHHLLFPALIANPTPPRWWSLCRIDHLNHNTTTPREWWCQRQPQWSVDDTVLSPCWQATESWWPGRWLPHCWQATPLHCTAAPPRCHPHDLPNLTRLHGSVTWHLHCTCEVYLFRYR